MKKYQKPKAVNNWMDNPYQDLAEPAKTSQAKKKQFFAHTDNNLKGISNLTKDEDLLPWGVEEQNTSTNGEKVNSYYFYPQKFTKHEENPLDWLEDL